MNREKSKHYAIDVVAETQQADPFQDLGFDICTKAIQDVRECLNVLSKTPIRGKLTYNGVYKWYLNLEETPDKAKKIALYKKLSEVEKELIDTINWILYGDYSAWADRPDPMKDIERVISQYPNVDTMGIYSKYTHIKKGA